MFVQIKLFLYKIGQIVYTICMAKVLLCSASPRRRELLKKLIGEFSVTKSDAEERSRYLRPHLRVMDLAKQKNAVIREKNVVVISSDTLVYRNGKYYGKPRDKEDAYRMLRELSGVKHWVYTGVCLRVGDKVECFYDKASVRFRSLSEQEIRDYVQEYSPLDKAGAYGIQDDVVVKSYSGSFDTIMGLPTEKLGQKLEKMGVRDVYK